MNKQTDKRNTKLRLTFINKTKQNRSGTWTELKISEKAATGQKEEKTKQNKQGNLAPQKRSDGWL